MPLTDGMPYGTAGRTTSVNAAPAGKLLMWSKHHHERYVIREVFPDQVYSLSDLSQLWQSISYLLLFWYQSELPDEPPRPGTTDESILGHHLSFPQLHGNLLMLLWMMTIQ